MEKPWKKWLIFAGILLLVVLAVIFAYHFDAKWLENFLQKYELLGLILCFLSYLLLSLTPVPSEPVTFIILAWKGPAAAIIMATIGNTLAAMVEFYIGVNLSDLSNFEEKRKRLPFHLDRLPINSPLFLLIIRIIPGFGPKFASIAGGIYKVPLFTYLWTTVVSTLLGAVLITLAGAGVIELIR